MPKDLSPLLPFGVAQFATLLPPGLPTGPASDSAGIDLPLRHLEPPSLRLSGPHLRASTILALESLIPVPGVDRIGTVIRMLCHIGADRIRRDDRHQIVPIVFPTKASIPNGRGARPCLAFFLRFLVDRIGHVCPCAVSTFWHQIVTKVLAPLSKRRSVYGSVPRCRAFVSFLSREPAHALAKRRYGKLSAVD